MGMYMTYEIITEVLDSKIEVRNSSYRYENKELKGAGFIISMPI